MRDYGKVFSSFWSSETIRKLSDDGRLLALYLLSCSHSTIAGVFRLPDGYACEDMQWTPERVQKGFNELLQNGFCNRCETTKWVFIYQHLEWNVPENPNQWKSAKKLASQVPASCSWLSDFKRIFSKAAGETEPKTPNPSETLPEPFPNQKQEQKQEQDIKDLSESDDSNASCPTQKIIDLYKLHAPALVQARIVPDAVKVSIASRWRQSEKHQSLEFWQRFFEHCNANDFLAGRGSGRDGGKPFRAGLEWIVKSANFAKIINGNYDNG